MTFSIARLALAFALASTGGGCGNALAERESTRADRWTAEEYSGSRTERDLLTAMRSKGFAWLSGSPADNEILSIGKNAQFFGFVALRYQSGRAADRGTLGRAFFSIADARQRELLPQAVLAEEEALQGRRTTRKALLRLYEDHLYSGGAIDEALARKVGAEHSRLGAVVAVHEARAFAELERALTEQQSAQLSAWRQDPEAAQSVGRGGRLNSAVVDTEQLDQFLADPKTFAPGTKMAFQGLLNSDDRTALIDHLKRTR